MTNLLGLVYAENDTKLSGPIKPSVVCDEIRKDNDVTDLTSVVYVENETKLS